MFYSQFTFSAWAIVLTAGVAVISGAFLHALWLRRGARQRMAVPSEWPLNPRLLANSEERKVWHWLSKIFYNHHMMVKIPVTRFTLPRQPNEGQQLYELLTGVYCTLTVCGSDGRVVGCLDVLGRHGISHSNMRLKRSLLSQCGINYLVIEPESLPSAEKIRRFFLGEEEGMNYDHEHVRDEAMIYAARVKLSAALELQRRTRNKDRGQGAEKSPSFPDSILISDSEFNSTSSFGPPTDFGSEWQNNSFLADLDSRRAGLHS